MNFRLNLLLLPFLLLAFLLATAACDSGSDRKQTQHPARQKPSTTIPDQVLLAEIDGRKVTGADLKNYLGLFKGPEAELPTGAEARKKLIRHLIDRELLLDEARKEGYFKLDELKKHGSLNQVERQTIALRAFLTDKISRPATPDAAAVEALRRKQPDLDPKAAREKLARQNQLELFHQMMTRLQQEHQVIIHHDALAGLPADK